jgi:hypothetical protein
VQPAPTHWGTLLQCLVGLKESEGVLHGIVNARGFTDGNAEQKRKREEVKGIVCKATFLDYLTKSIELLAPIQAGIVMFQSDTIALSEVYRHFAITMPRLYTAMDGLTGEE